MTLNEQISIATLGDHEVTLSRLARHLKSSSRVDLIEAARELVTIDQIVAERGLVIHDEELQELVDTFRIERGLLTVQDFTDWLDETGLSLEDVEDDLEQKRQINIIKETFDEDALREMYVLNRRTFERVRIAQIDVESEEIADEILLRIEDDEAAFSELARQFTSDKDQAMSGGYIGIMSRTDLGEPMAEPIFAAQQGDIVGPIQQNDHWSLVQIIESFLLPLDDNLDLENYLREALFRRFLTDEISSRNQEIHVEL